MKELKVTTCDHNLEDAPGLSVVKLCSKCDRAFYTDSGHELVGNERNIVDYARLVDSIIDMKTGDVRVPIAHIRKGDEIRVVDVDRVYTFSDKAFTSVGGFAEAAGKSLDEICRKVLTKDAAAAGDYGDGNRLKNKFIRFRVWLAEKIGGEYLHENCEE